MKVFVAVPVAACDTLHDVCESLRSCGKAVRVVPEQNWHLTLRFIGSAEESTVALLQDAIVRTARVCESFNTEVHGLGAFPHAARPSVIWAGVSPPEPWQHLADRLDEELRPVSITPRDFPFAAHLTLARVKFRPPPMVHTLLRQHASTPFGVLPVQRVVLYSSDTRPGGPVYTELASACLQESGR